MARAQAFGTSKIFSSFGIALNLLAPNRTCMHIHIDREPLPSRRVGVFPTTAKEPFRSAKAKSLPWCYDEGSRVNHIVPIVIDGMMRTSGTANHTGLDGHILEVAQAGVLYVMYAATRCCLAGREQVVREGLSSASALRATMEPSYPIVLMANERALALLDSRKRTGTASPFDHARLVDLDPRLQNASFAHIITHAYLFKLSCLMHSPFDRSVFLDCDVLVLHPAFVHDLLYKALSVSDVAMPLDPGRAAHLVPAAGRGKPRPPWVAPTVGPPMLCSAVLAFRQSALVRRFFFGAARRLMNGAHPGVRQGDQEMLWFEWTRAAGDDAGDGPRGAEEGAEESSAGSGGTPLRVLALPEEVYCPLEGRQSPSIIWAPRGAAKQRAISARNRVPNGSGAPSPAVSGSAWWRTSWRRGVYPCAAVHGHAYLQ